MSEVEMTRGKCPFPGVLVWSQQKSSTVELVYYIYRPKTVERVAAECTMHATNHSRSLAVSLFGLSDTTFCPRFNKIIRRLIFNLLWDTQAVCKFLLQWVYLATPVPSIPLLYLIKIILQHKANSQATCLLGDSLTIDRTPAHTGGRDRQTKRDKDIKHIYRDTILYFIRYKMAT